jgi:hypothetical protein
MLRDFFFKKLIEKKVQGLSEEQKAGLLAMLQNNPEFFNQITSEIKEETDKGADQQEAATRIVQKNQSRIMEIFKEGGFIK